MTMQAQVVLGNLKKAMASEEKLGFTDAGVVGGFHLFLQGILPRLGQLFPLNERLSLIEEIARLYGQWSRLERQQAWRALSKAVAELRLEEQYPNGIECPLPLPERKKNEDQRIGSATNPVGSYAVSKRVRRHETGELDRKETENLGRLLQYVKGVGPERARIFRGIGIQTVDELLLYFPRRYEDRRIRLVDQLRDNELATIAGKVLAGQVSHGKTKVVKLSIETGGRMIYALWFNQTYILKQYPVGTKVVITGKVRWRQSIPEIMAADIEKQSEFAVCNEIIPVYSETARLTTKVIRSLIREILSETENCFPEILPEEDAAEWMDRPSAYRQIHFPDNYDELSRARNRLVWEEILFLQLGMACLRGTVERLDSPPLTGGEMMVRRFIEALPFALTPAQQRVIQEIQCDMAGSRGMMRLVQGDVGSGKTVVAMTAILKAVGSGYQGAFMAPTEILAQQHYQSLLQAFAPLGISVVALLGSQNKNEREQVLAEIADGRAQVIVGTHALIQENVRFQALGLVVTDEQHRFGVKQRSLLQSKGKSPHSLVMSATPIPRTLALTLYGDLQLSVVDELPDGRQPVITRKLSEKGRTYLERFLEEQLKTGRQIFVVCPLVEESESLDLASAKERQVVLQQRFPQYCVALLHGRMKGAEKEEIMNEFLAGNIQVLVATTVVEVGVNVPNATVMVVEAAERFGLAQLHQLRGRVGRGSDQSYCFFMMADKNSRRIDVLCQTQDGFKIAEEDLRLRGPGEILGTRQHGLPELQLADLSRDGKLVEKAYQMAQKILRYPEKYAVFLQTVKKRFTSDQVGIH